jgi:riboflavin synthase
MFTGIILNTGTINSLTKNDGGLTLVINTDADFLSETQLGDSIAVNGVCLSVTKFDDNSFETFAQIETLEKTTLNSFEIGQEVNLEHPLRFSDRLGGHLVLGHVDGVATVSNVQVLSDGSWRVSVSPPKELLKYISLKGSVTLDGVSLTVASIDDDSDTFDVALIPITIEKTQFKNTKVDTQLNIEADSIARMLERIINKQ